MPKEEENLASCRTAANDLVFIVDGSWSVGYADFDTAKNWLVNITTSFDIGPTYTQVAVVQYSDGPRLEFPLGQHRTNQQLINALKSMKYLGGNTQTGRAIKFATENVFPSSKRPNLTKNRIAIVVTDGKSQDDVVEIAAQARAQNIIIFAVGVGSEITKSELVAIANSPSTDYVLFAEDYSTIERIKETMQQKICEESVCPTRIPVASRDEKGFELLVGMNIHKKGQMITGSLVSEKAYLLTPSVDVTENTREIFPEGLPPSYVFVATIRLQSPEKQDIIDLWRILSNAGEVQAAVTLDGTDKSVIFTVTQLNANSQVIKFKDPKLKELFDEKWHQLKILVKNKSAILFLDDSLIETRALNLRCSGRHPAQLLPGADWDVAPPSPKNDHQLRLPPIVTTSSPMEIQKLRLYCDPGQSERETACEIYTVNDQRCPLERVPSSSCQCPEGQPGSTGAPGPEDLQDYVEYQALQDKGDHKGCLGFKVIQGHLEIRVTMEQLDCQEQKDLKDQRYYSGCLAGYGDNGDDGAKGNQKGEIGDTGEKGPEGKKGEVGVLGLPGPRGFPGEGGPQGRSGIPGIPGKPESKAYRDHQASKADLVKEDTKGTQEEGADLDIQGSKGYQDYKGDTGPKGEKGSKGERGIGQPGTPGPAGSPGMNGVNGEGIIGPPGNPGKNGVPGTPGKRGFPGPSGVCDLSSCLSAYGARDDPFRKGPNF
ncbi:PREDICTED: collagen alpha-1(XXI) chain-like [Nanorana parkeri]|uniref:collagen alpha-1(XXI) chain-like n=1 Tax=Nanorana parkeri TaxID=125878 RepID=UPI0008548BCD|nr:PREDICTED: collagen alpha-1(XXI) chain-like [Nanorana parkeri]